MLLICRYLTISPVYRSTDVRNYPKVVPVSVGGGTIVRKYTIKF